MVNYKGIDIPDYVKILDIRRPLLASQSLRTLSIEGKDGSFYYGKSSESATVELDLIIVGEDPVSFRKNVRDFSGYIDADEPSPLILPDEPDKYINAVVSGDTGLETLFRAGKGTVTMFAPDPYYYAIDDDVFEFTDTGVQNFSRQGNTESYPVIRIEGTSSDGGFTIKTDHNSLTFEGKLNTGETLVVDSMLLTAYIIGVDGGTRSAIPDLVTLDFPVLDKGANSISVGISGDATLDRYRIECNSRWK